MKKKAPSVTNDLNILIICEGYEEEDYLNRLKQIKVWNRKFGIVIKNAKSIDNIAAMYEYYYVLGTYKLVIAFCDTELAPYDKFLAMKEKINKFHGKTNAADSVVFFANPCTMQIILSHFSKVSLKTNNKSTNANLIYNLTKVANYEATANQRSAIAKKINDGNYLTMKDNIKQLSKSLNNIPSSNVIGLFDALDIGSKEWIEKINKEIE